MPEFTQLGPTMGFILELKNNLKKEVSVAKAEMEKLRQESVQTGSEIKRQFKAASAEIREMGQQLQSMGMKMTIGVTLPLVAAGAVAVKTAADVEEMTNKFGVLLAAHQKTWRNGRRHMLRRLAGHDTTSWATLRTRRLS